MSRRQHTFCRICEASCGLIATVEDGRVVQLEPNSEHIGTQGFACVKGLNQHHMYDSPDRLRHPLKRIGREWHRVSWEQALAEIGEKVAELRGESPHSLAMYVGTAAGFGVLHPIFAQGFMQGIGSRNIFSSATQDCANRFAMASEVYGFPFTQPFPDLEHTNCLIVIGTNPVVSKWTFLQVANPVKRLKQMAARGALDPRRTESAKAAGEHHFIRPNTDVWFFLAFLRELFEIGVVDHARVERFMTGLKELEAFVAPWTPERSERVTTIPAAVLRELVRGYADADGAALVSGTGVGMGTNGTLAVWLLECINAVSGNLDRRGGTLVGKGVFDFAAFGVKHGLLTSTARSRIGNFKAVNDGFPGAILADEILTPGEEQIRALFVTGGNPLLTMPNAGRLRDALSELELLVVTDIYLNETASLAHYVLPATSPLQRPDLPFVFPLFLGFQSIPYLAATKQVVEPEEQQRDEASIYADLARAAGIDLFGSRPAQLLLNALLWLDRKRRPERPPRLPQTAILSLILRLTRSGSFARLLRHPNGQARTGTTGNDFLGQRIVTPDGLVHLAPRPFLAAAEKLEREFERECADDDGRFRLITRRSHRTHNSWTQNALELTRKGDQSNYLYMHPEDAAGVGLDNGEVADVCSDTASLRVPIRFLPELMRGTVALPHGWGHQHAAGLSVASKLGGVNVNLLAADGPEHVEALSGMAQLTGIPVEVKPAAGPVDISSWSGRPES
ncbi:MAG: molybdopterin-dependent oxidoreductase [Deltaproteobacteria bacterium]|nr:molybdopterin-dependent oxidoreductase [Deltaproteobacteria bacterium]